MFSEEEKEKIEALYQRTKTDVVKMNLLLGDDIAIKLLSAWPPATEYLPEVPGLWGKLNIDFSDWCESAGLPDSEHNINKCLFLIRHNFVLPDGRLHCLAEMLLKGCLPGSVAAEVESET